MSTSTETTIKAAMTVAKDIAEGRLDPAELARAVAEECRALFGAVVGPDDPLWPLQTDVARQVLAQGGVSADELAEWAAVARRRAAEALERSNSVDDSVGAEPATSGPLSPQ